MPANPPGALTPYYSHGGITLYNADCLDVLPTLPAASVDLVLADLPYGTTACAWDSVIPLDKLWAAYKRVCKPTAALVLFGSQPFTSVLVTSNLAWFKYALVWDKGRGFQPQLANVQPMKAHEDVLVFGAGGITYNPQKEPLTKPDRRGAQRVHGGDHGLIKVYENGPVVYTDRFPVSVLYFPKNGAVETLHPTQKPLPLIEYLMRTYSNPGDLVLDNTMGSGTTPRAAKNLGRRCIGIDSDTTEGYCAIAADRLAQEVLALEAIA